MNQSLKTLPSLITLFRSDKPHSPASVVLPERKYLELVLKVNTVTTVQKNIFHIRCTFQKLIPSSRLSRVPPARQSNVCWETSAKIVIYFAHEYLGLLTFYLPIGDPKAAANPEAQPAVIKSRFSWIAYNGKCRLMNTGNFRPNCLKPVMTILPTTAPIWTNGPSLENKPDT